MSEFEEKEDREEDMEDARVVDANESGVTSPVNTCCAIFEVLLEIAPFLSLLPECFKWRLSPLSDLEP
jgi:hypothetical protein